jgi:adenylate cyclase
MRVPIGVKLAIMTVLILLAVAIPSTQITSKNFAETVSRREENINLDSAAGRASHIESIVENWIDKTKGAAGTLLKTGDLSSTGAASETDLGFYSDRTFFGVEVRKVDGTVVKRVMKDALLAELCGQSPSSTTNKVNRNCSVDGIGNIAERAGFPLASVIDGSIEVQNATLNNGPALFILGMPLIKDETGRITHIALAYVDIMVLQKPFSQSEYRTFFATDKRGILLAHSEEARVLARQDFSNAEIVRLAGESPLGKAQRRTHDSYRKSSAYSAFSKTKRGITVFAESPEDLILEPVREAKRDAILVVGLVLAIMLFFVPFISGSLTSQLAKLVRLIDVISKGNFDVNASGQIRSLFRDEVNTLANAFDQMTAGLKERDKVKGLFMKFHGSSVTEDILKGEGGLKGQRKDVMVFFSDIRGFTAYSEKRDPEEIVEMLNEYFAIMVGVINKQGGVVDKFIGDAIMAIWGAPHSNEKDAHNALMACLLMRKGLEDLNVRRIEAGKSPLMIGMGLHSGSAISGTIGSNERMEYTVIGNTVNTTSRIEASTKSFGTDLLVTEEVVNRVGDDFWVEYVGSAELKGRSEDIKLYKVRGYKAENGKVIEIKTPYSDYESEVADKVKVKESA